MSDEDATKLDTAALLAELRASRIATENLTSEFSTFKADTAAKISNLEKQNERLRREDSDDDEDLIYVAHYRAENPFPNRPRNATVKPQSFDLYGDRTADLLENKPNSSLRWEYRTLAPTLSYFFDAKTVLDSIRETVLEKLGEEESLNLEGALNTLDGCYTLLTSRYATIKIRTRAESEPGGLSEENKLLLDYLDTKLHGVFPGEALVDSKMEKWLDEFREKRAAQELKNATQTKKGARASKDAEKDPAKQVSFKEKRAKAKKTGVKPKPSAE
jgi:hypothetical protein